MIIELLPAFFVDDDNLNSDVLVTTKRILKNLIDLDLIPSRVQNCIEGGITIIYKKEYLIYYLEIYNDGEIGYIIENTHWKKIIFNSEIKEDNIVSSVNNFLN